jgi:hypothetical protein
MFGFLALEFLMFGFFFDQLLLETGTYTQAIDVFNSIILFILLVDFVIKFFFKQNQSMQIAPYLTLPVKRNTLFNFLLIKEFGSFWNLFWMFLVAPFAFKSITPFYGLGSAFLYILFFYLLCIVVSLIVNLVNFLISKNARYYFAPALLVALPVALVFWLKIPLGDYTQQMGDWALNINPLIWLGLIALVAGLWFCNRLLMRELIYSELQGEKIEKISSFSNLSFLDRLGVIGDFINLEIKMIFRSKRLKQQTMVASILLFSVYTIMLYVPDNPFLKPENSGMFIFYLYSILTVGMAGIIMGQYIFTCESSFFDGLMARRSSLFDLLQAKYLLYFSYSLLVTLLLLIPAFQGKISLLFILSSFFFVVGPIYFMIFQNAVYNKTFFDLFDKGMMNWKGQSGNMIAITMITMFVPVIIMLIINSIWGQNVTCYFMLATGQIFTVNVKARPVASIK